jgi:hypothetical protein
MGMSILAGAFGDSSMAREAGETWAAVTIKVLHRGAKINPSLAGHVNVAGLKLTCPMGATPILLRGEKHDVVRIEPVPSVLDDALPQMPDVHQRPDQHEVIYPPADGRCEKLLTMSSVNPRYQPFPR